MVLERLRALSERAQLRLLVGLLGSRRLSLRRSRRDLLHFRYLYLRVQRRASRVLAHPVQRPFRLSNAAVRVVLAVRFRAVLVRYRAAFRVPVNRSRHRAVRVLNRRARLVENSARWRLALLKHVLALRNLRVNVVRFVRHSRRAVLSLADWRARVLRLDRASVRVHADLLRLFF